MDPVLVQTLALLGVEGLKFLASVYIQQKRTEGMTDEQILAALVQEYADFKANNPDNIPEVK